MTRKLPIGADTATGLTVDLSALKYLRIRAIGCAATGCKV
jgi:hypothetical protein